MTRKRSPEWISPFDCHRGRHKVITPDRICVLCGARGVVDARSPLHDLPDITEPRHART